MTINGILVVFLVGCFGGVIGEMLKWYQLRESPNLPIYSHKLFYWFITVLMILAGGGLAVLYGTDNRSALLVANIGLSAPLIVKALAGVNPVASTELQASEPRPHPPASPINFLAGR